MVGVNQTTLGLDPGCVRSVADYLQKTRNTRAVSANKLSLLSICSFRMSVLGGFATSLGGKPFLLPWLSQLALGLPIWLSDLLMMPAAIAAMAMKALAAPLLKRFDYRQVLIFNMLLAACAIASFALVGPGTPLYVIVCMGLAKGMFNSLQF